MKMEFTKRIKGAMNIGIFFVFIALFFAGCEAKKYQYDDKLSEYVEYLVESNVEAYDYKKIEEFRNDKEVLFIIEENRKKRQSECLFVKGMEYVLDGETKKAIEKLKKSIQSADESQYKLITRAYVELAKMYIEDYDENMVKEILLKIYILNEDIENKDYFIQANGWIFKEMLNQGRNKKIAFGIMKETYDIAVDCGYKKMAEVTYRMSQAYRYLGDEVLYMNYLLKTHELAEKEEDYYLAMFVTVDIGNMYTDQGNSEMAIKYYNKMSEYSLDDKSSEAEMKAYAMSSKAYLYIAEEKYEKARECLKKCQEYISLQDDGGIKESDYVASLLLEAQIDIRTGNFEKAKKNLDETKMRYENSLDFTYNGFDINLIMLYGMYYQELGDLDKALVYYLEGEKKIEETGMPFDFGYMENIYEIYKAKGDYKNALAYKEKMYDRMMEGITSGKDDHILYLMEEFEDEQKEKEIELLQMQNKYSYMVIIFVSCFSIVLSIAVKIIFKKSKELKKINRELEKLSRTDGLTKLLNRRTLDEYLETNWDNMMKSKMPVSIAMFDIDYFKAFNDNYGHQMGDRIIKKVATVIKENARKTDFIARYGGEEFIMIMPETNREEAGKILIRMQEKLRESNIIHEYSKVSDIVTMSVGLSTNEDISNASYREIIKRADCALYKAKETRNTIAFLA